MLTAALLLVAGLSNAAAFNISGTVTGLPAGRTAQITATSSAGSVTASSALDGTYSVAVADNATYTVRAKAFPLADPSPQSVPVSGANVTGINFALTDATRLWLKFDGDLIDSSGLGNHGSVMGAAVTPARGRVGGGCLNTVDGNGGVLIANALTAGLVDSYTMSAWLRVTGSNPWHEIYASNPWVPTAVNNWLVQERAGQRQIMATVNFSGDALQNNHPETWALGDWHFITIVYDSGALTTKFYFDGMPDGSFIHTKTVQPNFTGGSTIGCWGSVNERPFRGEMDDLRIVATAAQDGDVAALYASYPPPHTITATADTHATISPSGAVPVVDGYDRTFSIRAEFGYSLTAVLVDGVAQALPLDSYTFSNVTADHTIAVSSERTPTRHISGTVTGLPAGRTAQVTASVAAGAVTVSSALDGTYSIEVPDNDYYTVSASAFPLADPFLQYAFVYGADETGIDFALTDATLLRLKFDGDVLDSSGLGNDGSLLGAAVTPAHGRVGGGCLSTVDGNGGVLIANALTAGPVDSYTMSAWLRVTGSNPWHEIYASNPWVPTAVNNWLVQERAGQRQIMATVNGSEDALQNNHPETWALGDWHFITIVYNSVALTTKFYFDGMPDGSFIHTKTVQPNFTGGSTIGCWGDVNNRPFRGEIDDLRIVATAAKDGDVAALYASYPALVTHTITATAGANATISPSGAVSLLDGYDQTFSISAPLGFNITAVLVDGVAQGLPLDSYTFSNVTADHTIAVSSTMVGNYRISGTVTGIPAGHTALVRAAIPGTNFTVSTALDGKYSIEVPDSRTYTVSAWAFPLADPSLQSVPVSGANVTGIDFALTDSTLVWYKFDGDGLDSSGNAKDGGLQGGAVYGSGRVGTGALDTTAANGAFSVPELGPEINTEYPSFTMSAWMKPTQLTGWQALYQAPGWELHDTHVVLEYNAGTAHMLLALNQGGDNDRWQDNMKSVWPLNTWHLETIVYDSVARTVKFYFDGVLVNTGTYITAATAIFQANAYIGSGSGNVNDRSFHGKIDDFRIFGIAAGDADVAALYASYPALVTHTITATAGANATISPSGAVSVLDGEAQTFSISAPLGYNITAVLVDGVAQGLPLDSYTFSNVTADHTIAVSSTKMPTYHIRGTVTGLPAGRTAIVRATAPGGSFAATTALDGTYSIEVADTYTYTVSAWAFPLADLAPQSVPVSATDVTGIHFALTDATLLWLKFDGDVLDSSGRANDGSLLGAAVISGGGRVGGGGCLSTVNGNGGVVVANELSGMIDSYTMSAWMRVTIPNDWATLWMPQNWGYNVVGNLFRNRPEAAPQYRGMMATTGGTADVFSNNHWSSWALGHWHFITIVYDSVALTTKFYFDGMSDGAVAHTAVYQAMFPANGRIGCWSNPNDRPFRGEIDDFRIVGTAAQDGDVAALYASYPIQILPLSGFTMPGGVPTFVVPTVSGYQYRLVYKDNLTDGAWMQGPWTPGTGGDVTLSDSTATGQPHRFYRLEVQ